MNNMWHPNHTLLIKRGCITIKRAEWFWTNNSRTHKPSRCREARLERINCLLKWRTQNSPTAKYSSCSYRVSRILTIMSITSNREFRPQPSAAGTQPIYLGGNLMKELGSCSSKTPNNILHQRRFRLILNTLREETKHRISFPCKLNNHWAIHRGAECRMWFTGNKRASSTIKRSLKNCQSEELAKGVTESRPGPLSKFQQLRITYSLQTWGPLSLNQPERGLGLMRPLKILPSNYSKSRMIESHSMDEVASRLRSRRLKISWKTRALKQEPQGRLSPFT